MAEQRHSPLKDDRLNDPNEHIEVVFDGSITLWRSATNLDVVLVYFEKLRCMELLVFHPVRVLEAPRIYIDFATLEKHLPRAEMQKQVEGRKELFLRRHCTYVASEIEKEVEMTTISNYVVSRIAVADGDDFIIELQAHFGDTMESDMSADGMSKQHLDFVIGKPEGLIPINTEHYAKPSIEEFQRRIYLIEADQESIKDNFTKVHKMLRIVELAATAFRGGKLHTTNPSLTLATLRWKRAINRVINRIMCEKVRILLQKMEAEALLRRVKPHSDAYYRGINGAGALAPLTCDSLLHRKSKFENHLPKGKDYRHDEDQHHVAIRILSKASFRRSCILDATYDDNSVTTDTCSLGSMSPPESSDGLAHRSSLSNPSTDSSSFHVSPPHGLSQLDILLAQQTSSRRSSLVSPHLPPLSKGLSGIHPPPKREASQRIQLLRSFDHGKPSDLCSMPSPSSSDGASVPRAPN